MNYVEYGKENSDVLIFLHGGGLSWWSYKEIAEKLSSFYHVVLPILDGHANSENDFTTMEANAARIIRFIDIHFHGSVLLIGGLSLGAQIVLEILSQRKNICKFAVIESALVIPSKITHAMIKPAFGSSYGLIQNKSFSKLQFKSLKIKDTLFDAYYRDTCAISKTNMIAFLEANSLYSLKPSISENTAKKYIFVGEKENKTMIKSARIIHNKVSDSSMEILPDLYHGEFSINHADKYVKKILDILE